MKLSGIVGTLANGNFNIDMTGAGKLLDVKHLGSIAGSLVDASSISNANLSAATSVSKLMKERMDSLETASKAISSIKTSIPDVGKNFILV